MLETQRAEHDRLKKAGHIVPHVLFREVADGRRGEKQPQAMVSFNKAWKTACRAAGAHRARTAPDLARRVRIILACAEGHDNTAVAKRLRMSQTTACKWRGRFVRERLDGLYDEPRPGAPRQISDEQN